MFIGSGYKVGLSVPPADFKLSTESWVVIGLEANGR